MLLSYSVRRYEVVRVGLKHQQWSRLNGAFRWSSEEVARSIIGCAARPSSASRYNKVFVGLQRSATGFHIAMCLRVLRDVLVSRYCKRKGYG